MKAGNTRSRMILVSRLRNLLDSTNTDHATLADHCGVDRVAVSRWVSLTGAGRRFPTPENIDKIANFFSIPVRDLFIEFRESAKDQFYEGD